MKSATKIKTTQCSGGVEGWLDAVCIWAIAGGVIVGGGIIFLACRGDSFNYLLCGAGVAAIAGGCISGVVCKGLAEIIRLLKRQSGIEYSGQLRAVRFVGNLFACSRCQTPVFEEAAKCSSCGAEFDGVTAEK